MTYNLAIILILYLNKTWSLSFWVKLLILFSDDLLSFPLKHSFLLERYSVLVLMHQFFSLLLVFCVLINLVLKTLRDPLRLRLIILYCYLIRLLRLFIVTLSYLFCIFANKSLKFFFLAFFSRVSDLCVFLLYWYLVDDLGNLLVVEISFLIWRRINLYFSNRFLRCSIGWILRRRDRDRSWGWSGYWSWSCNFFWFYGVVQSFFHSSFGLSDWGLFLSDLVSIFDHFGEWTKSFILIFIFRLSGSYIIYLFLIGNLFWGR